MGHFRPGFSSHVVGDFIREERYSVVAAMDINGIVAFHTVPNAFNTKDFNFALENFIAPSIGRFALGEPRSVVVMVTAEYMILMRPSASSGGKEELQYSYRMY